MSGVARLRGLRVSVQALYDHHPGDGVTGDVAPLICSEPVFTEDYPPVCHVCDRPLQSYDGAFEAVFSLHESKIIFVCTRHAPTSPPRW